MTRREYLLLKIMEESAEVSHAAAKIISFGEGANNPKDSEHVNNLYALIQEQIQLMGAFKQYLDYVKQSPVTAGTYEQFNLDDDNLDAMMQRATEKQVWLQRVLVTNQIIQEN